MYVKYCWSQRATRNIRTVICACGCDGECRHYGHSCPILWNRFHPNKTTFYLLSIGKLHFIRTALFRSKIRILYLRNRSIWYNPFSNRLYLTALDNPRKRFQKYAFLFLVFDKQGGTYVMCTVVICRFHERKHVTVYWIQEYIEKEVFETLMC